MWSAKPSGGDRDKWNTIRVVSTGPRTNEPICESTCGDGELSGKRKIGRPVTTGKPWEAEGISRQAWYKRDKQLRMKTRKDGEV
jgi:hypothetical protein